MIYRDEIEYYFALKNDVYPCARKELGIEKERDKEKQREGVLYSNFDNIYKRITNYINEIKKDYYIYFDNDNKKHIDLLYNINDNKSRKIDDNDYSIKINQFKNDEFEVVLSFNIENDFLEKRYYLNY